MPRRGFTLAVLFTAEVLVMLDGIVVSVALPEIGDDVGLRGAELQWVITAYTLPLGAFLLVGGRAADLFGRRRLLVAGLCAFAAGSLLAGLSRAALPLIAGRALAGLGAACAIPAALALTTAVTREGRDRNTVLGWMSATIDVGMVGGAVLGGLLTYALGWPWVFLALVPVALAAAAVTPALLPEGRDEEDSGGLDWAGAATVAGGVALLILALVRAQQDGPGSASTLAALAGAAVLLAAFAATQLREGTPLLPNRGSRVPAPLSVRTPLLPRRLVSNPRVMGANLAIVANAGAFGGTVVLSTLFMQRVLGLSALETGVALVPLALSALAGGFLAPRLIDRLGTRRAVALSLVATAGCLVWIAALAGAGGGYWDTLFPAYCVAGCTFATAAVPLTAAVVGEARARERGLAAGLFQTFTHVGGALVLAILVVGAAARTEAAGQRAGTEAGFALATLIVLLGAAVVLRLLRDPRLNLSAMSVLEQVQSDVRDAMKAGERERVHALRLIANELQKAAKENGAEEVEVLQRERKRRLEAAEAYRDGGRTDAADAEEREAEIISTYLPAQLSDDELDALVGDAVAESGASSPNEMGKVMGLVMPKVKGRADGKRVSAAVREKLIT
ncbi:MAG TPA: GatB/YqeY domain-containing protein [Thermoleophilaceae bacterium]|nr:GatB/YqeY domain-containing protein [Thermoleophilaceae bacterium]